MYSISTSWNAAHHTDGRALINEIRKTGLDTVELSFALTAEMVDGIAKEVDAGTISVSSIHNMCPLPHEIHPSKASPDFYSLSSPDNDERKRAVSIAQNTIDCAVRLRARAVVLHIGRVEIKDRIRELAAHAADTAALAALRTRLLEERAGHAKPFMAAALKSLDELVPYALGKDIALGIENRYYYREIPVADELAVVLERFKDGELWYWHDVGHAAVAERLGLCQAGELLRRFGKRLLGIHLHDILNVLDDHQVPGQGDYDFTGLVPFVRDHVIKVVEVHVPSTADEISRGVSFLRTILGP